MRKASQAAMFAIIVVLCIVARVGAHEGWLPAPPNFAPMAGAALLAGVLFRSTPVAIALPLAAMAGSDLLIGGYEWQVMLCVYATLLLPVTMGRMLRNRPGIGRLLGCTVASSLAFFAVTNFAVWAFSPWYEQDLAGLVECFVAALPFFKYTLAGDLAWTAAFFAALALSSRTLPQWLPGRPALARVRKG
ncbi:MAG: hypothetical protein K1X74_03525 [Pirellulales bacterium]|nr:hypothetical protein [Pirellulales bacterium]